MHSLLFSLDVVSVVISSDSEGELHVLSPEGSSLGVDAAEVSVLEQTNEVSFGRLLEGSEGLSLDSEVGVHLLDDFPDDSDEGSSGEEEVGALLVPLDLPENDSSGLVSSLLLLSVLGGLSLGNLSGGGILLDLFSF